MKKLITALAGLALITTPAQAHEGHWHRGGGHGWVAPLVLGGIIGGVIVESTQPREVVVTPPAPVYHTVVVSNYYDMYRGGCEIRDTYDQYNNFVTRQTVCYGR